MASERHGPVQVLTPLPIPVPSHSSHGKDAKWSSSNRAAGWQPVEVPSPHRLLKPNEENKSEGLIGSPILARSHRNSFRRLFVQTDNGAVVVVEVDSSRAGGPDKVKRTVQAALNLPTEQADLVFGGEVLEDLNELQNDVPVLLRRGITRSASSPNLCVSCPAALHTAGEIGGGSGGKSGTVFEIVGGVQPCHQLQALIEAATGGVRAGVEPVPATGGLGGAYYFRDAAGGNVVIVKPTDEEPFAPNNPNGYVGRFLGQPGLKKAIRVGEAGLREVAAFLLDHGAFAGVPHTALVKASHSVFNFNVSEGSCGRGKFCCASKKLPEQLPFGECRGALSAGSAVFTALSKGQRPCSVSALPSPSKLCSLQQYVQHDYDASEHGTSRFPVAAVHRIGILDVRIFNTDRHSGNILVRQVGEAMFDRYHRNPDMRVDQAVHLIPIDHGFCLPETLEGAYFEWLHWPQASLPFSEEELEYIAALDVEADVAMLRERLPMLREGCLRVLTLGTTLLQRGALAGLSLGEIGAIMSRDVRGMEETPSELELLCLEALNLVESNASAAESKTPAPLQCCALAEFTQEPPAGHSQRHLSLSSAGRGDWDFLTEATVGVEDPPESVEHEVKDGGPLVFEFDDESSSEWSADPSESQPLEVCSGGEVPVMQKMGSLKVTSDSLEMCLPACWPVHKPLTSEMLSQAPADARQPSGQINPLGALKGQLTTSASCFSVGGRPSPDLQPVSRPPASCVAPIAIRHKLRQAGSTKAMAVTGSRMESSPGYLKLGSAGRLGLRLRTDAPRCTEQDLEGHLPGGASIFLSDMEQQKWELFYATVICLLDDLLARRVAGSDRKLDVLGTSCQF